MILPEKVWNNAHTEAGTPTGGTRRCRLAGCTGLRIGVRWPNGKLTWLCTKALTTNSKNEWQVG